MRYAIYIFILVIFQIFPALSNADEKNVSSLIVEFEQNEFSVQAENALLGNLMDEVSKVCGVEISGLEKREDEPINFSFKGMIEEGLKQLLRHLGENNYAFEFSNEKLIRLSVLPGAKSTLSAIQEQEIGEGRKDRPSTVVRIQGVIDGSQAQALGLLEGDLIIEYDGVKIRSARQLIRERKKKAHKDQVEVIVIRNSVLMPFILGGGIIGVRIKTIKIPENVLEYYDPGS